MSFSLRLNEFILVLYNINRIKKIASEFRIIHISIVLLLFHLEIIHIMHPQLSSLQAQNRIYKKKITSSSPSHLIFNSNPQTSTPHRLIPIFSIIYPMKATISSYSRSLSHTSCHQYRRFQQLSLPIGLSPSPILLFLRQAPAPPSPHLTSPHPHPMFSSALPFLPHL